jgi:hypothetical protein
MPYPLEFLIIDAQSDDRWVTSLELSVASWAMVSVKTPLV